MGAARRHCKTERENTRIEIRTSALANSATTARLSHASSVVVKFTVSAGRVTALDLTIDPDTLSRLRV